jgi:hypothetical protein
MTRILIVFLVALLALPATAGAQRGGVFVDPDSPAGTEYRIPLEEARRLGAGDDQRRTGEGRTGTSAQPLFGEGIQRAPGAPGSAGDGNGESGSPEGRLAPNGGGEAAQRGGKAHERRVFDTDEGARDGRAPVAVEAAVSDESDTLVTAGIAGVVLAAGLLVGFAMRRLLRTD